ncbi:hypothetical protein H0H93_014275 [Arthromyces matolae]|nr:hypothetical protein H0H93_014275 [Arthromyces matolae]
MEGTSRAYIDKPTTYALDRKRRAALQEIEDAPFSWFHVKVCLVAGVGCFTDAYDIFAINIVSVMLGYIYGHSAGLFSSRKLTTNQDFCIKVAGPIGILYYPQHCIVNDAPSDLVGPMIVLVGTFAQTLSGGGHSGVSIFGVLVVWRFLASIGIGGDYALGAVMSSEFASSRIRGRMMAATFSAQGWGNFGECLVLSVLSQPHIHLQLITLFLSAACLVALITVASFKHSIINGPSVTDPEPIDVVWRIIIGLGCVPGVLTLYSRFTMPETPRFIMDIERNVHRASHDKNVLTTGPLYYADPDAPIERVIAPRANFTDFLRHFSKWKNGKVLFGTAWSWFAFSIAFYGLGLNSSFVLQAIGFGSPLSRGTQAIYDGLWNICIGNLILSASGLIPGYYFTFFLIDSWGRKPIQLMGFIILAILFAILGFGFDMLTSTSSAVRVFVALYCLANFFQNFGPNSTTYVVPAEVFPTRYRSTAHSISAASGKLGAIIAQVGFAQLKDLGGTNIFVKHILEIFALFMCTGIFSTLLIPETKGVSLEEHPEYEPVIQGNHVASSSSLPPEVVGERQL